jgi:hypothetical protein
LPKSLKIQLSHIHRKTQNQTQIHNFFFDEQLYATLKPRTEILYSNAEATNQLARTKMKTAEETRNFKNNLQSSIRTCKNQPHKSQHYLPPPPQNSTSSSITG